MAACFPEIRVAKVRVAHETLSCEDPKTGEAPKRAPLHHATYAALWLRLLRRPATTTAANALGDPDTGLGALQRCHDGGDVDVRLVLPQRRLGALTRLLGA